MARPKRNAFAALGWVVWKLLAIIGIPMARKKLEEGNGGRRRRRLGR